ncbi:MAG: hypothetical protein IJW36_00725 [Clostridia bacterium]|nr:hypothetical protein [Clostridia bacterium]
MIKRKSLISVFVVLLSFLACCFIFQNNENIAYALDTTIQDCYYLIGQDGNPYESSSAVGTIEGTGKYVVGESNIPFTATANNNYEIVGWQIVFEEQENNTLFVNTDNLVDNQKTVELTAKDGITKINAIISFDETNGRVSSSTFMLDYIFEDLTVRPVFDHLYYFVDITEIARISKLHTIVENQISIGEDVLFYETSSQIGEVTTYSNAFIKMEGKYYYYGELHCKANKFYTTHLTQNESQTEQEIEYSKGAFKAGDSVEFGYDLNINSSITSSVNVDLISVSLVGDTTLSLANVTEEIIDNTYKATKDIYSRTTRVETSFNVISSTSFTNVIDLNYHNLYVVDLQVVLDDNLEHEEINDIFGSVEIGENEILGNISIYNFYSRTNDNNLQFLVKKAQNNGEKSFGISCAQTVSQTVDGSSYKYYDFVSLDNNLATSSYYSNINQNIVVEIKYSSAQYKISFLSAEYVEQGEGEQKTTLLTPNNLNVLEEVYEKRGGEVELTQTLAEEIKNTGYTFKGYAMGLSSPVQTDLTYVVDKTKPQGTEIYMCFEKNEYVVKFENYNKVEINGTYALNAVSFVITNGIDVKSQTLYSSDLVGESVQLDATLKIDGSLTIMGIENAGFSIIGYSIKKPTEITNNDYFSELHFSADFIDQNVIGDEITIYVYEDIIKYTLTYVIEETEDTTLKQNVIMANIDAVCSGATITKYKLAYDAEGNVIYDAENKPTYEEIPSDDTTSIVAKIVVSNLKLNDEVALSSFGFTQGVGEEAYTYSFNWFTVDNKTTLSYIQNENTYTHTEVIDKSRTIKVVYSMPSTKVIVTIEEDLAENTNFSFVFTIETTDGVLSPDDENVTNVFTLPVGTEIKVTISNIAFGYYFDSCEHIETGEFYAPTENLDFAYPTKVGVNTLLLKFKRIEYHFIFEQYGAGFNGEIANINEKGYAVLNVDNTEALIEKPIGYFVSGVLFGKDAELSETLSETNEMRHSEDMKYYTFKMARQDFINIATTYGVLNEQNISEVNVKITYSIFTYTVKTTYGITNPKGNSNDASVTYPAIKLEYIYDAKTYVAAVDYSEIDTLKFVGIPYGSSATMTLVGDATLGFSLAGWTYADGSVIGNEYAHSMQYLTMQNVSEDKNFKYLISYNAYYINVVHISGQGSPEVYIRNVLSNDRKITLYDQLKIVPNALRSQGYAFDNITYKTPSYTQYAYNADNWNSDYLNLYVLNNGVYQKNTNVEYNANTTYFVYKENIVSVNSDFVDNSFMLSNYVLDADGKTITFNVNYKLLEISIINSIAESKGLWSYVSGKGNEGVRVKFDLEELVDINISATNLNSETRTILENDFVYFHDTITVALTINKTAKNIDGSIYDLSLGLGLKNVNIAGTGLNATNPAVGEYLLTFYFGDYIASTDATNNSLTINYTLQAQKKAVEVTTIVQDSTNFYENVQLFIDANKYGFTTSYSFSKDNAPSISSSIQFLAKADLYTTLTSDDYRTNFVVAGVNMYCDGELIPEEEYVNYGIVLNEDKSVTVRLMSNIEAVFIVQPKITYNGGPAYIKTFICDNSGVGISQQLTLGTTSDSDIQVDEMLINNISLKYISTIGNAFEEESVTNVGKYKVLLTFMDIGDLDWLSEITVAEDISLEIRAKDIYLTYNPDHIIQITKTYDGTSDYNVANIYKYLIITDNASISINYSDIISDGGSDLAIENAMAYVSSNGKDAKIKAANENMYYNLYVYDFTLKNTAFNNNFSLKNSDLVIANFIKITRRQIKLHNIYIYNKVYDGTDKAELVSTENITISNTISGDDVAINIERLNPRFDNNQVGTNKKVILDASAALVGKDVANYYIEEIQTQGLTIYPYSMSVEVRGYGRIEIINKRGLTEKDKVGLIPLNAVFVVTPIYAESNEYVSIYNRINNRLKGNNEFAIGYQMSFLVNGENIPVNNNLYLSIPSVKNLTGVYFLTGQHNGAISYTNENGNMIIDLSQISEDVDSVFLTKTKILLKAWQIVLIVIGSVLIIATAVLLFIIIRKRKIDRDSVHEKI